ncbi:Uroporphyrinogen decarboxylase [Fragariocoptes setiger]|uniref:Uroporphyrinogen decarboxylase n=1 Tax=Fragariocoptes setiger TaxID=1670756 RepID=A0ABQ7SAG0_9ACAR|nr:Uroporphyrinogen decarboxylase [Fragariocoptes setiger]
MDTDPNGLSFPRLKNDCILKAAHGQKTDYVPVWIMRQAGRYLPEFRELRKQHSFFTVCETPELACQVTLMPIKRFDLDASIIFSDILVIPQALGMQVDMTSEGPKFPNPLVDVKQACTVLHWDVDMSKRLDYVYKAITLTRHELAGKCPLVGFSGAPWTLMCYMIEGGGSKTMSKAKKWLYQSPVESEQFLDRLSEKIIDYLLNQIKAGAQMLQLFESNAEYLNRSLFEKFSYPFLTKICQQIKSRSCDMGLPLIPICVFAKGAHYATDLLTKQPQLMNVISLDWTMDPVHVRSQCSSGVCLQGNLDPCALYADPEVVSSLTRDMLDEFGTQSYIANLGHGIYPDGRIESVEAFIDTVHKYSRQKNNSDQLTAIPMNQ